jgi:type I restriction enzyme, S subunit
MANDLNDIPNTWIKTSIGEVCHILDSMRVPVNAKERNARIEGKNESELFPYYGATGEVGEIDGYLFEGEYILLGEDGAPFLDPFKDKAYLVSGKFWVNNHAHILKAADSNRYICHYFNQFNFSDFVTGTTRLKLNQSALKEIPLPLPPLAEQRRIVAKIEELFTELDAGIASLRAAQAQLKTYRQALLKHAFEGKLTAAWRAENAEKLEPAAVLLRRIADERQSRYAAGVAEWEAGGKTGRKPRALKDVPTLSAAELTDLPALPAGWAWVKVGQMCDVVRGGSPRPAGNPKYYEGKIPFLKVADVTHSSSPYLHEFTYTIKEAGLAKTRLISPKTLLLSNSGATLGVPKICMIEATMNDGIAAFLGLPPDRLLYHYYFWQSKTSELRAINQGAAQPNLNTNLIQEIAFPFCSVSEQKQLIEEVESRFSVIDQLEQTITSALQQAESLRQSILQKAFAGQLVPQDENDEPASALLARIRAARA